MPHWFDDDILWPDFVLPSQMQPRAATPALSGLFNAILLDALECLQHPRPCTHREFCKGCRAQAEARAWVGGAACEPPYFSFADVCSALGLAPTAVRRAALGNGHSIRRERHISGLCRTKVVALRT